MCTLNKQTNTNIKKKKRKIEKLVLNNKQNHPPEKQVFRNLHV